MSIKKILNYLEKSWDREDILLKIKTGIGDDEIVNEFLVKNEVQIKELNNLLRPEDIDLLNNVEKLSTCESKLINKINNFDDLKNNINLNAKNEKKISLSNRVPTNRIGLFMFKWSNKFVVIALLIISVIALSKQAWA